MRTMNRKVRSTKKGMDAFYFLMTFIGALLLELPGLWCFLAAGITVTFFLLFLHSTRQGRPRATTTRLYREPVAADAAFPQRDAC